MVEIDYYQNLYKRFKELANKTSLGASNISVGEEIKIQNISVKDLEEKLDVQKKLLGGLTFLTDNQLIDLSGDAEFTKETNRILNNRNLTQ